MKSEDKAIKEFCNLCNWAYNSWSLKKHLFDENIDAEYLKNPRYNQFFLNLHTILQENWLLQVAKLHDPAIQNGRINLTVNYIINYVGWEPEIKKKLQFLEKEMSELLDKPIRDARNKILSHNDLGSILEGARLGEFSEGNDSKYFQLLSEFTDLISQSIGEIWSFYDLTQNDVAAFMNSFKKGADIIDPRISA